MVPWPRSPSRCSALAMTSRTSFTLAVTADSDSNDLAVLRAMSRASVVLPVPAGPQRMTDDNRSVSISARSGRPGPRRWSCPTMSSRWTGRSRSASGAWRDSCSPAATLNRSSGAIPRGYRPPLPAEAWSESDREGRFETRPRGSRAAMSHPAC